jgi:hypothetical protein
LSRASNLIHEATNMDDIPLVTVFSILHNRVSGPWCANVSILSKSDVKSWKTSTSVGCLFQVTLGEK